MRTKYIIQRTGKEELYDFDLVVEEAGDGTESSLTSLTVDATVQEVGKDFSSLVATLEPYDYIMIETVHEEIKTKEA